MEDNKVTIEFDTSLITTNETVCGYIYFEKVEQSADVCRFCFNVKVSEIDKLKNAPIVEKETRRLIPMSEIVTKSELQELFKTIEKNGGTFNDTEIRRSITSIEERVQTLETKEDKDTVYNDEEIKRRLSNLEGKTDNFISGVSVNKEGNNVTLTYNYVDGQAKNVSFTDSDTINIAYDDSALKTRLNDLENRPQIDVSEFAKKSEVPTAESVTNLTQKFGEQSNKIQLLETKAGYEIHGTGIPNGRVSAPIGTTYVDTAVTNGALKWIKESGDGDRGWKILIGDTGWRTLNSVSKLGNSFVKVRRVNNQITYQFGGLEWGWFGIVRRGGGGYFSQPTDTARNCYILNHNKIPEGFRTPNSLIGAIYNDRGVPYGTWYIGNPTDANHLRFQFLNPVPTDQDIGDIRVSSISYYTDDEWPSTLP